MCIIAVFFLKWLVFVSFYMIVYNEGEFCFDNCILVLIDYLLSAMVIIPVVPDILQVSDIMAYGSTPYVGMTPKKNGSHIKVHK